MNNVANMSLFGIPISILYAVCLGELFVIILHFRSTNNLGISFKSVLFALLLGYIFLIFCSTILYRPTQDNIRIELEPLWFVNYIIDGAIDLLIEKTLNVLLFVPIGFLIPLIIKKRTTICKMCIIGMLLSSFIEILQFVFKKGVCEIDDIILNTLGSMVGYLMVWVGNKVMIKYCGISR